MTQCKRISRAARKQNLITAHAAADLRQADRVIAGAGRVNRIADPKIGVIGQNPCRIGKRLFERIGWIIGGLAHWVSVFP